MEQLKIHLEPAELDALSRLAEQELRPVPQQARHLVRQGLRAAGMLPEPKGLEPSARRHVEPAVR